MFDYKKEFLDLVDLYQIQDGATRLIKAQELENAFTDRLQAKMLKELTDEQRDSIIKQASEGVNSEDIANQIYNAIYDIDTFINDVFENFVAEFKANI